MTVLRRLASIASWILRRDRIEQQLDDEIRSFVEMSTADRIREGVSPTEARRLALAEIGGVESMKEIVRAGRHGALLDDLGRDVRYAFRLLARQRMFAAVIVGTLALGIGANVALFSVVNSVLLRPLPYHEPDRLVRLASTRPGQQPHPRRVLVFAIPRSAAAAAGVQRSCVVRTQRVHADRARRSRTGDWPAGLGHAVADARTAADHRP